MESTSDVNIKELELRIRKDIERELTNRIKLQYEDKIKKLEKELTGI